jgi:hypothetical protein
MKKIMKVFLISTMLMPLCFMSSKLLGQEKSKMDWDNLSLNVVKVYTATQIKSSRESLTPKSGSQIVVLDIKANVPTAMDIILNPKDFVAKIGTNIINASAIGIEGRDQMIWGLSGVVDGGGMSVSPEIKWHNNAVGDISFSVGFLVSDKTNNFKLICGKAVIEVKLMK